MSSLCCCYHWKYLNLGSILETFETGFDGIIRNVQAETREFVSYKERSTIAEQLWQGVLGVPAYADLAKFMLEK